MLLILFQQHFIYSAFVLSTEAPISKLTGIKSVVSPICIHGSIKVSIYPQTRLQTIPAVPVPALVWMGAILQQSRPLGRSSHTDGMLEAAS